jgi:hypothetical protein
MSRLRASCAQAELLSGVKELNIAFRSALPIAQHCVIAARAVARLGFATFSPSQ